MDLEDCPPGTEGYHDGCQSSPVPERFQSFSAENNGRDKKTNVDKFLPSHTIRLSDGTVHRAFECIDNNGSPVFLCFPCGVTCIGEVTLQYHLNGKKHANRISGDPVWPASIIQKAKLFKDAGKVENTQNETPEENASETKAQSALWNFMADYKLTPVIGLEYMLELVSDTHPVSFFCSLCEIKGDNNTIINHIIGFKHRIKFLTINFPTAYRALCPYMNQKNKYHKGYMQVVHNICNCVEQAYGRLPPQIVSRSEFEADMVKCMKMCIVGTHFSEKDGTTFEDLVDDEYITMLSEIKTPEQKIALEASEQQISNKFHASQAANQGLVKNSIKISINNPTAFQEKGDLRNNLNELKARRGENESQGSSIKMDLERCDSPDGMESDNDWNRETSPSSVGRFHGRGRNYRDRRPIDLPPRGDSRERIYAYRSRSPRTYKDERDIRNKSRSPIAFRRGSPNRRRSPFGRRSSPYRRSPRRSPRRRPSPFSKASPNRYTARRATPPRSPFSSRSPLTLGSPPKEKVQFYDKQFTHVNKMRHKLELLENRMMKVLPQCQKSFEYHEKNPEKHPLYQEEWKKFWNKRYKELKSANVDTSKHDFKPEWILYWGKRIKELYESEVEALKLENCRLMSLPTTEPAYSALFSFMSKSPPKADVTLPKLRNASPPSEFISKHSEMSYRNKETDYRRGEGTSRGQEMKRNYQPVGGLNDNQNPVVINILDDSDFSPWDDDDSVSSITRGSYRRHGNSHSKDSKRSEREVVSKDKERNRGFIVPKKENPEFTIAVDELNVISVLRLLTALENYLGSLGPKIMDLLAVALKMEKKLANSSDEILLNDTYNVLFETAKEKLKGQLLAGLVESNAVQATKSAIQHTAALMHKATQMVPRPRENVLQAKLPSKDVAVKVEGIGTVEKAAIAKQIAAALVAQGKTNVTTTELESLVNAVVGMAKNSQPPPKEQIPTEGYLTQLQIKKSENVKPAASREKVESCSTNALQMLQSAYTQKNASVPGNPAANPPANPPVNPPANPPVNPPANPPANPPNKTAETNSAMEGLSDSDLKTLLQNFKDLSADEQHGLIAYLKKLESKDPRRVETLRQFVNLEVEEVHNINSSERELSPFCQYPNPAHARKADMESASLKDKVKLHKDSDDDDDYTFDEVIKSAAEKVKEKQLQEDMEVINKTLKSSSNEVSNTDDTQAIISSLMVSLKQGSFAPPAASSTAATDARAGLNVSQMWNLLENVATLNPNNSSTTGTQPIQSFDKPQPPQSQSMDSEDNYGLAQRQDSTQQDNQFNDDQNSLQLQHQLVGQSRFREMQANLNSWDDNFSGPPQGSVHTDYTWDPEFPNNSQTNIPRRRYPPPNATNFPMGNSFSGNINDMYGGNDHPGADNFQNNRFGNNPQNRMQNPYNDPQMMDEQDYYYNEPMQNCYRPNNNFRGQHRQFQDEFVGPPRGMHRGNGRGWGPPPNQRRNFP